MIFRWLQSSATAAVPPVLPAVLSTATTTTTVHAGRTPTVRPPAQLQRGISSELNAH